MKNFYLLITVITLLFTACSKTDNVPSAKQPTGIELLSLPKAEQQRLIAEQLEKIYKAQATMKIIKKNDVYIYNGQRDFVDPLDSTSTYIKLITSAKLTDTIVIAQHVFTHSFTGTRAVHSNYALFNDVKVSGVNYNAGGGSTYTKHNQIDGCGDCELDISPFWLSNDTITFYPITGIGGGEQLIIEVKPVK